MREPIRRLDERRAASNFGVGDVDVVGGAAKRNLLLVSEAWQAACRLRLCSMLLHAANKAHAFAWDGAHEFLLPAAVTNCFAHRIDPAVESRIRNNTTAPNRCDEIILADDAIAVLDEIDQQIEDLRLDRDDRTGRTQFAALAIEREILK